MVFTLLVALPAAFGFVRYQFRGKGALNLLMMVPLIVPAVVSALGYYGFLSLIRLDRHPCGHDHRAQRAVDSDRLPGDRGGAQGLRPQPRARRHERRRRAAAHVLVGDAAGAAARHPGRRAVRVPAFVQRSRGGDLHRRARRRDAAEEDVRIDPPRIRSRHRRGLDAADRRGAGRRAGLTVLPSKARLMPLDALVNPRSVAIVGATDRPGPGASGDRIARRHRLHRRDLSGEPEVSDGAQSRLLSEPRRPAGGARHRRAQRAQRAGAGADAARREARRARGGDLRQRLRRARRRRRAAAGRDRRPLPRGRHGGVRPELHGHPQSGRRASPPTSRP